MTENSKYNIEYHKKKRSLLPVIAIILAALVFLLAVSYAGASGVFGETVAETLKQWFNSEQPVTLPPGGDDEEPGDQPGDPPEEPDEPGEPSDDPTEPGDSPGDKDPTEPVIYVGQVLTIPVSGGGGSSVSQVITGGTVFSNGKQIALTFDSGWETKQTIPMLDILDQYRVTATFFPRALWVRDNPNLAREIVSRGHSMGNHSLTHKENISQLPPDQFRYEISESTRIIEEVTGVRPFMFRPPFGEHYNQRLMEILAEEGYPYNVRWTIDTHDCFNVINGQTVNVDYVVNRVLNNASNNGIILMHIMDRTVTVEALPRIIEGLRDRGYSFATVDEMLPAPGLGPVSHVVKSGETLYSIATRYSVTVQQIVDSNNL